MGVGRGLRAPAKAKLSIDGSLMEEIDERLMPCIRHAAVPAVTEDPSAGPLINV